MIAYTECWARDGIQAEGFVSTSDKLQVLDAVSRTGASRVEVTSLVKESAWPQFADAAEVLAAYTRAPGVEYSAYVPNVRGLERLLGANEPAGRIDAVLVAVAASDSYNVKNVGRPTDEALREVLDVIRGTRHAGLKAIACVGTAWACPIEGEVSESAVLRLFDAMIDAGAGELALGDTTGEANPTTVRARVAATKSRFPAPLSVHFHDARGTAVTNAVAALEVGVDRVEGALGGVGGHPPDADQVSASGNLCTEDFAALAEAAGWDLGLDIDRVLDAGREAQRALGRRLLSRVQQAGLPRAMLRNDTSVANDEGGE